MLAVKAGITGATVQIRAETLNVGRVGKRVYQLEVGVQTSAAFAFHSILRQSAVAYVPRVAPGIVWEPCNSTKVRTTTK